MQSLVARETSTSDQHGFRTPPLGSQHPLLTSSRQTATTLPLTKTKKVVRAGPIAVAKSSCVWKATGASVSFMPLTKPAIISRWCSPAAPLPTHAPCPSPQSRPATSGFIHYQHMHPPGMRWSSTTMINSRAHSSRLASWSVVLGAAIVTAALSSSGVRLRGVGAMGRPSAGRKARKAVAERPRQRFPSPIDLHVVDSPVTRPQEAGKALKGRRFRCKKRPERAPQNHPISLLPWPEQDPPGVPE
eukprot:Sspe_Gene.94026::Locus_66515_Transcript_1_1_Confidence_1.000_Length_788::g.94026::m.94026